MRTSPLFWLIAATISTLSTACSSNEGHDHDDAGSQLDTDSLSDSENHADSETHDTDTETSLDGDLSSDADRDASDVNTPTAPTAIQGWVTHAVNQSAVVDAIVRVGERETTTNSRGMFYLDDLSAEAEQVLQILPATPGLTSFSRRISIVENEILPFSILLAPMSSTTFDVSAGVSFEFQAGSASGQVVIPANGLSYADGSDAEGTITIYALPFDVTERQSYGDTIGWDVIPGDMTGIDDEDDEVKLESFGMMAIELYDSEGVSLNLKEGSEATLAWNLDPGFFTSPPESAPTWWYDENTAMWRQDGLATLGENQYTATVSHFTIWNVDVSITETLVYGRLLWQDGSPAPPSWVIGAGLDYASFYWGSVYESDFSLTVKRSAGLWLGFLVNWKGIALAHIAPPLDAHNLTEESYDIGDVLLPWFPPPPEFPHCIDLSSLPDGEFAFAENVAAINLMFGTQYEGMSPGYYDYADIVVKHVGGEWNLSGPSSLRRGNPSISTYGIAASPNSYEAITSIALDDFEWLGAIDSLDNVSEQSLVIFTRDGFAWSAHFSADAESVELCYQQINIDW
jgi:hypothetical protein